MDTSKLILYLMLIIVALSYLLELLLSFLNRRNLDSVIPEELDSVYDPERYGKSQRYEREKSYLSMLSSTFSFIILFSMLAFGGFGILSNIISNFTADVLYQTLIYFAIIALASDIMQMPFSWYATFVIETKYGFNKITPIIFFSDKLKGYMLAAFLGGSLLALFVIFYQVVGADFWIYMVCVFTVVMLFLNIFYTAWIVPLFNKLIPIREGEIKSAIDNYCKRNGFPVSDILIMDGSKRSTKANAFFSGMGKQKKVVLFDTLVNNYSTEEIVAVVAHEVGHYNKRHNRSTLLHTISQMAFTLFLLSTFITNKIFSEALGSNTYSLAVSLTAFAIIYTPLSMVIGILMNAYSRKNEFEADAFAKLTYKAEALISALKKLSKDSLSNLTPHPLVVFFYYSHPTLLQRVRALTKH
jgi:STE24 endopeptidase